MLVRAAVGLMLLCGFVGSSTAGTWRVEQDGSGDFTTIQPAVDAAASGDTILIGPGWYQDLHQVDHYGTPISVAAYWLDARDLTFIGSGPDQVTIGPAVYSPSNNGPKGIAYDGTNREVIVRIQGIRFVNLFSGVSGAGAMVNDCRFVGGRQGISCSGGVTIRISDCTFEDQEVASALIFSSGDVEVSGCNLGQYAYFGDTTNARVHGCVGSGRMLCHFYRSGGSVEDNTTDCATGAGSAACINANGGSRVLVRGNLIGGGGSAILVDGPGTHVELTQNVISDQSLHTIILRAGGAIVASGNDIGRAPLSDVYLVWCYDYPWGSSPVQMNMENNFWGYTNAYYLDRYIWDHNDDPSLMVEIDYDPFAGESVPAEAETWGSVKAQYLGR